MASFDDLMSSARGPGVIGTVLALVVLIGFSGLFLLVFEENPKGSQGITLPALVKRQESDIDGLHSRISVAKKNLEAVPALEKKVLDIETITRATRANKGTVTGLQGRLASLREMVDASQKQMATYKAKYRAYLRDKAKGEEMEELTTISGKTFKKITVREVTPIGMQIRHADGFTRIPYEDLPLTLQQRFQFDQQEKLAAAKVESSSEQDHYNSVAAADAAGQVQAMADREKQKQDDKLKVKVEIATLSEQIKTIDSDIIELQRQATRAQSQTASAKAAGHMVIDRSNNFLYAIQSKKNQRAELLSQIQSLKSKL